MKKIRRSETEWTIFLIVCFLFVVGIGRIEGTFFPAAAPMKVERLIDAPNFDNELKYINPRKGYYLWGNSVRLRPNCHFRDLRWFAGERGGRSVPLKVVLEPAKIRSDVFFKFGPWWIENASGVSFFKKTYADAYHQCIYFGVALPYWVISPFWN